ncbi:MAG TPA: helix-turn-helix domain-containing protein, partial [Polyangiaceae bacterium]|nr:helix-turn-helix domain-containing protein [Polyangiaceae bacterium]
KRLARQEVTFLMRLAERSGQIVHRDSLVDAIWGTAEPDSNGLDVLAWRIRKKLGAHASLVETVRGGGYRLRIDRLS